MRGGEIVLRTGVDGAVLIPDRAYARAFTLRVGGTDQSYVDLDDPRRLDFDYVRRMADLIDVMGEPGARMSVVHVGGAAMTVPRYVAATRPSSAQIVLEPDTELTDFVRLHLPLPRQSGIKVRASDGATGLAELRDRYADLIIVDAFVGAQVPADLTTVELFTEVARVLRPAGIFMINITDRGPFDYARRVVAGIQHTFDHTLLCAEPATLKGRRFGNVIVAGSLVPLPVDGLAERAGRPPFPYRVLHGARLVQLVAGAAPFTASDAECSPLPTYGPTLFG
jgi:hypothetical protein